MRKSMTRAVLASLLLAGCAGIPPAGTPERDEWTKRKQEESAAIERAGRVGGSLDSFPIQSSR